MKTFDDIIKKATKKVLREAMDNSFSLNELSLLPSYTARVRYCKQHLGNPIGNGSSRTVFQISDERCLKLAKNEKGLAQNQAEANGGHQHWYEDLFPYVFETDNNDFWMVSEYVLPAKKEDFMHIIGMTFEDFCKFVRTIYKQYARGGKTWQSTYSWEVFEEMLEKDDYGFLYQLNDYMCNWQVPYGDLCRIQNWGLTVRNGSEALVILDSGLNEDVYNTFYNKNR